MAFEPLELALNLQFLRAYHLCIAKILAFARFKPALNSKGLRLFSFQGIKLTLKLQASPELQRLKSFGESLSVTAQHVNQASSTECL